MPRSGDQVLGLGQRLHDSWWPGACRPSTALRARLLDLPLHPVCPAEMSSAKAICDEGTETPGFRTPRDEGKRGGHVNKGKLSSLRVRKPRAAWALCDLGPVPSLSGSYFPICTEGVSISWSCGACTWDPVPAQGRSISEERGQHAGWQVPGSHIAPTPFTEHCPAEPVAPGKGGSLPIIISWGWILLSAPRTPHSAAWGL